MDMGEAPLAVAGCDIRRSNQGGEAGREAAKPASEAKPAGTAGCFTSQTVQST